MAWSLKDRRMLYWLLQGLLIFSFGASSIAVSAAVDNLAALGLEKIEGKVPAPSFSLVDLQGKPVALESLRDKGVMLYFWASW